MLTAIQIQLILSAEAWSFSSNDKIRIWAEDPEKIVRMVEEEIVSDRLVALAGDLRMARMLSDIGNGIFQLFQFTVDCPSSNAYFCPQSGGGGA